MGEEFYDCQLNTTCRCGNSKPFGHYVCNACWIHVTEDLKTDLVCSNFADERMLVKRVETIARNRNPDHFESLRQHHSAEPLVDSSPKVEARDFRRSQQPVPQTSKPGGYRSISPEQPDDCLEWF